MPIDHSKPQPSGKFRKILITGSNGLIGQAVIKKLCVSHVIYAMVRQQSSMPFAENVTPIIHNLTTIQEPDIPEVPDTIIHLAQSPFHRNFPEGARDLFEVNTGSTQRLLDWGQRMGVKRFVYASSGGVYGSSPVPFVEDELMNMGGELDYYLATKRSAEVIAEAYRSVMDVTILRFFFVYGPRQPDSMLIPRLIDRVRAGLPVSLQGQDGMRLNPTFVDDAANAVEAACGLRQGETINVVGPQELTMREVAEIIGDNVGCVPKFDILPDVAPKHMVGSAKKMIELLGQPKVMMRDGIARMVA